MPRPPSLNLDILETIADLSLSHYRRLLAHPRFARSTIYRDPINPIPLPPKQLHWQHRFTECLKIPPFNETWKLNGKVHRVHYGPNAGPALYHDIGLEIWCQHGQLHRLNGPTFINNSSDVHGTILYNIRNRLSQYFSGINFNPTTTKEMWYYHNKKHREDGPAITCTNGSLKWMINGEYHRIDGPAVINSNGEEYWYYNGKRHRPQEGPLAGPATKFPNGSEEWWFNDKKHRIDGPAVTTSKGTIEWWFNGKRHHIQEGPLAGPAIITAKGDVEWWLNGNLHRIGTPAIIHANDDREWWTNGMLHREGAPAIIRSDGSEEWWFNGQCHRLDGPAVTRKNGTKEWWVNGEKHSITQPAVIRSDGQVEWWVRGSHVKPLF
jgi:hypothetical protein